MVKDFSKYVYVFLFDTSLLTNVKASKISVMKMKYLFAQPTRQMSITLGMIMILGLFNIKLIAQSKDIGVKTIVIDPGHGGKDPGAVGASGVYEKDIALDVSIMLGDMIKKNHPDVTVIYTRDHDKFVSLYDRAHLANEKRADLFISIHANAASNRSAYGSETWVLGLHKSAAALEVAKRENASILMEDDHETKYSDFNPSNPDDYIGLSLRQNVHLDHSLNLAAKIQDQFKNKISRYDRGVKQAGFLVLYKTTMPAVLVELGFVSNAKEEKFLDSDAGKTQLATSIYNAFAQYKKTIESVDSIIDGEEVVNNTEKDTTSETPKTDPNKTVYKVQFQMSSEKLALESSNFKGLDALGVYESNGFFKYTSGEFDTFEEANTHKNKVRASGYSTAFVVVFKGDKRIK